MSKEMKFDLPKDQSSIIKVIGVGGGGSNAVNYMFNQGINGVDFLICNTDQQAIDISPVPHKIQLGPTLTEGRGAGSIPKIGRNAAIENIEEIKSLLQRNTKMVFITAGMGGGTGTGAAPIIAQTAKELEILTVGIVTLPFNFEGRKRKKQAEEGIEELRKYVDTLLIINNDKLREMYGNLKVAEAFGHADNVLTTASKGIAEIITRTGYINVDFEDVRTVMNNGGVAIMGSAQASGDDRAIKAVEQALSSPLLNDNDIKGAKYVLLNISFGTQELLMDEISDITDYIQDEAGETADVIWGYGKDETLGDSISVTIIATGFTSKESFGQQNAQKTEITNQPRKFSITDEVPTNLTNPFLKPTNQTNKTEENIEPEIVQKKSDSIIKQGSIEFDLTPKPKSTEKEDLHLKNTENFSEPFLKPKNTDSIKPPVVHNLDDIDEDNIPVLKNNSADESETNSNDAEKPNQNQTNDSLTNEERQRNAHERMMRLKSISSRLKTPNGIVEMENQPAYLRKQIKLDDVPHSAESQLSRYSLNEMEDENGKKKTELRSNNSFLHDNVD